MDNQKLSERVEALEGPDREVDASILAFDPNFTANLNEELGFVQYWTKHKTWLAAGQAPNYTASLDAAMSLVPEGCLMTARTIWHDADLPTEKAVGYAGVDKYFRDEKGLMWKENFLSLGATPALALCAAALKCRGF